MSKMNCPRCQTWIAGDRVEEEQKLRPDGSWNIHDDARCADALKAKMDAMEMVASCAKDIVDAWPNFSFKQVRSMCFKMDALKEALEMVK